jgi:hypothetical protein
MRPIYTFLAGATVLLISSCSSTNTVRQTPDDVYYSPKSSRAAASSANNNNQDEYYSTAPSDQYVRMKTVDQARWSTFDDYNNYDSYYSPVGTSAYYGSAFSPYGYGYGYSGIGLGLGYFNPYFGWNSYFMWNTCYNPYFYNPYYGGGVILINPKVSSPALYSHLGTFNPSSYHLAAANNSNGNRYYRPGTSNGNTRPTNYNNNPGSNSGSRYNNTNNYFRPANSGSTQSFSPSRSFTPSGGGGGGGGFRPSRH